MPGNIFSFYCYNVPCIIPSEYLRPKYAGFICKLIIFIAEMLPRKIPGQRRIASVMADIPFQA